MADAAGEENVYFASCAEDGGIYHYRLDKDGRLRLAGIIPCDRPMYMAKSRGMLHVILREPFPDNGFSGIISYKINSGGELYAPSGIMNTRGRCGCHLCVFHDRLYAVNYLSGNVFCSDGTVRTHHGRGVRPDRQEAPHTHYIGPAPDGRKLLVTDLGLDRIFIYDGGLNLAGSVELPEGSGPRHIASADDSHVFCVNELDCSVSMLEYKDGKLVLLQTISLLGPGSQARTGGAAIRTDGGYVYVSNRWDDTISVIRLEAGRMYLESAWPCGGKSPRDFQVAGNLMLCANQESSTVTIFNTHKGRLAPAGTGEAVRIPEVLCVCVG